MSTSMKRDPEELSWQAFCYVAGEMAPEERDRFESALGEDVAACEAVAEAVELVGAVRIAEAEVSAQQDQMPRHAHRFARKQWVGVAAAIGLLALPLTWMVMRGGISVGVVRDLTGPLRFEDRELVLTWSGLRGEESVLDWLERDQEGSGEVLAAGEALSSWMVELAALEGEGPEGASAASDESREN